MTALAERTYKTVLLTVAEVLSDSTVDGVDVGSLAQYGVLGVFAILLTVFARWSYKREIERADRLEKEVNRLNAAFVELYMPAITQAMQVLKEVTEVLKEVQYERRNNSQPPR